MCRKCMSENKAEWSEQSGDALGISKRKRGNPKQEPYYPGTSGAI